MKLLLFIISIGAVLVSCDSQPKVNPRDYQIDLHIDTVRIYDGDRLVGSYISTFDTKLDSILLKDNL